MHSSAKGLKKTAIDDPIFPCSGPEFSPKCPKKADLINNPPMKEKWDIVELDISQQAPSQSMRLTGTFAQLLFRLSWNPGPVIKTIVHRTMIKNVVG